MLTVIRLALPVVAHLLVIVVGVLRVGTLTILLVVCVIQCAVFVLEALMKIVLNAALAISSIVKAHVQRLVLTKPTATARTITVILVTQNVLLVTHKKSACRVNEAGT